MKILGKNLALISFLVIGSTMVLGQKTFLLGDIQALMADASDTRNDVVSSTEYNSSSPQFHMEDQIQLEDWMISGNEWETIGGLASAIRLEKEADIVMEDWMLKPFELTDTGLSELVEVDEEDPLKLQKWMYCCTDWRILPL
jgi:hypothetical protein